MSADPAAALSADAPRARRKKRRPVIAFLLSLLTPGLGQLYATRVRRGIVMIAITLALMAALHAILIVLHPSWPLLVTAVGVLVAQITFQIGSAIDALAAARRAGTPPLTRLNRVWIYIAIVLAMGLAQEAAPPLWAWKPYQIPAASMQPTLQVGDYVMTWHGYFADHPPQPGDLVVFKLPRDNTTDYVKRIVGLPGQRIQMRSGRLYIDDAIVARERLYYLPAEPALDRRTPVIEYVETLPNGVSYRIYEVGDAGPLDDTPVFAVPPGHVFVLGDNRDNSIDSRTADGSLAVGFVPFANLRDRPRVIFWSRDRSRLGLMPR